MTVFTLFRELIDLRSFSSLWYWLVVAAVWSHGNYFILGVPLDLILRARKEEAALGDVQALLAIKSRRMLQMAGEGGAVAVGFVAFVLVSLTILGFVYKVELAQAVALILLPLALVGLLRLRLARRLTAEGTTGAALLKRLLRHRRAVQGVGALAILATGFWGMSHNLTFMGN